MFPESKDAPVGPLVDVTVWVTESPFVHAIVLLIPITTVIVAGWKFRLWFAPTPAGIDTWTVRGVPVEVEPVVPPPPELRA